VVSLALLPLRSRHAVPTPSAPHRSPPGSRGAGGPRDGTRAPLGAAREHEPMGGDRRSGGARVARSAARRPVAATRV